MAFLTIKSNIRTIRKGDPKFLINDGSVVSPRAGFELSEKMADGYREIVMQCIANGWLKPVAYVKDSELMWETLGE